MRNFILGLGFILAFFYYILTSFTSSIAGKIEGMICIECQEMLIQAFKDELGVDTDIEILVSWEEGIGVISFPNNKNIDEEKFTQIVENSGFKVSQITTKSKLIKNLDQANKILNE
jgi:hypothetical protein